MVPFISPRVLLAFSQWQTAFVFAAFLIAVLLLLALLITSARKRRTEIECERLQTEQQSAEHARQQTVENNRMILDALSRNEAQLAAIINSAMDGIITVD